MSLSARDKLKIIRNIRNSPEDDGLVSYMDVISYCDEYAEQSPQEFGVEDFAKRIDEKTKQPIYSVKIRGQFMDVSKNEYLARLAIYMRNAATDTSPVDRVKNT